MLQPFDVALLAKLCFRGGEIWSFTDLAHELRVSESQCHRSFQRLVLANLAQVTEPRSSKPRVVNYGAATEFFVAAVRYCFYPERGAMARGLPTGVASPLLEKSFSMSVEIPVWPHAEGYVRGYILQPFYKQQAEAAKNDEYLHQFLGLLDAIRDGKARERNLAKKLLTRWLKEMEVQQHARIREY